MSHKRDPRPAYCYYLITHGARHDGRGHLGRPEAKKQSLAILQCAKKHNLEILAAEFEFRRSAKRLADFRVLRELIRRCANDATAPAIVIDDVTRILRRLPEAVMLDALKQLAAPADLIHDAFMGRPLHALSDDQLEGMAAMAKRARHTSRLRAVLGRRAPKKGAEQTEEARLVSKIVRSAHADDVAYAILDYRNELEASGAGGPPSFAEVARLANARGYPTPRGSRWTSALVSRALKRLKPDATGEDRPTSQEAQ